MNALGGVNAIDVAWSLEPACDVIESGLLVGRDPTSLQPSGVVSHGPGPAFAATLLVSETAMYWIAAYARDEDGGVIVSLPTFAVAMTLTDEASHGSHGALPSYTGTDADFLQQAGEPHFASIRALDNIDGISNQNGNSLIASRLIASTHRDEVEAAQFAVMPLGLPSNPAQVVAGLALLDQQYVPPFFPRKGLYAISCLGLGNAFNGQTFCRAPITGFPTQLGLSRQENVVTQSGFFTIRNTRSSASSVSFFIPKAAPSPRVKSAQFTASFFAQSTPDAAPQPRLNDKPPVGARMNCGPFFAGFPEGVNCNGVATWDFTEEARTLAAGDGGLFVVAPSLMPAFHIVQQFPSGSTQTIDVGALFIAVAANYPWFHGSATNNALTVSFEASCPRELSIAAMPESVRPQLPGRPTGEAQVRAQVKSCPPGGTGPSAVVVRFQVDPKRPEKGTDDAGGHVHDGLRPHGELTAASCTVSLGADGTGACSVGYRPSPVSGIETVIAKADGFNPVEVRVRVGVPNLVDLAEVRTNFFRLTGKTDEHLDNHWGTVETIRSIQLVALDFLIDAEIAFGAPATLGINDISLRQGGLFDICGTWDLGNTCRNAPKGGHTTHRLGTGVDIDRLACRGLLLDGVSSFAPCRSGTVPVPRLTIERRCSDRGGTLAKEDTYHCDFPR